MLSAMVLAAGLGTRLKPLTELRAKALVHVGDRPVLTHVLDQLWAAGAPRITINTHHRARDLEAYAASQRNEVLLSNEPELLGTAGGVSQAEDLLGAGDVLVWNADILAAVDIVALVRAHGAGAARPRANASATLLVRPLAAGQGNVGYDSRGTIVRLRRESVGNEAHGGEFVGVHILGEALRRALPARGCLVGDVYIPALKAGATLGAHPFEGAFFDVGTLGGYLEANRAWLAARAVSSWTADGARVPSGIVLEESVVGAGATLSGHGRVVRAVIWPGAVAVAPISDAIVTTEGVVAVSSLS
jgi:mannose-1-phosphate guanylyltransferase